MLAEAGKVVKTLSTAHVKSIRMAAVDEVEKEASSKVNGGQGDHELDDRSKARGGLLDSGASNPLRPALDGEMAAATKVKVTLAGEDTKVLNQTPLGTIIVPNAPESREFSQLFRSGPSSPNLGAPFIGLGPR